MNSILYGLDSRVQAVALDTGYLGPNIHRTFSVKWEDGERRFFLETFSDDEALNNDKMPVAYIQMPRAVRSIFDAGDLDGVRALREDVDLEEYQDVVPPRP